jgi:hypothetical protein
MISSGIRWHVKKNCVMVRCSGEYSLDAMKKKMAEVKDTCADHCYNKVLINASTSATCPEFMDFYELASFFEKNWKRSIRVAILAPSDHNDRYKFFETVAKNRGILIETFADADQAQHWLDSGETVELAADAGAL